MCMPTLPSSAHNYKIKFEFEQNHYETNLSSFFKELIVLPDGTMLAIEGWNKMEPPQVVNMRRIEHTLDRSNPTLIAMSFNACLAVKI